MVESGEFFMITIICIIKGEKLHCSRYETDEAGHIKGASGMILPYKEGGANVTDFPQALDN